MNSGFKVYLQVMITAALIAIAAFYSYHTGANKLSDETNDAIVFFITYGIPTTLALAWLYSSYRLLKDWLKQKDE